MGAEIEELEDGLKIPGGQMLHGAVIDSFGDHRIAMAFAVAALRATGETTIHRADAAVIPAQDFFGLSKPYRKDEGNLVTRYSCMDVAVGPRSQNRRPNP